MIILPPPLRTFTSFQNVEIKLLAHNVEENKPKIDKVSY